MAGLVPVDSRVLATRGGGCPEGPERSGGTIGWPSCARSGRSHGCPYKLAPCSGLRTDLRIAETTQYTAMNGSAALATRK